VTVAVLTDTTSALSPAVAEAWGIRLVPLTLTVGGRTYRDGEIDVNTIHEEAVTTLHTAGPTPGEFVRELTAAADAARGADGGNDGTGVSGGSRGAEPPAGAVIITVARSLSSTYACALLAAESSGMPVEVVDSGTAAGGQALVAIAAAQEAGAGGGLAEVAKAAKDAAATVRLVGCITSLDRLVASGRVPEIAGAATRRLGLWPMFELTGGRVRPLRPARSAEGAMGRIAGLCARSGPDSGRSGVADVIALNSGLPGDAEALLRRVRQRVTTGYELSTPFGSAMTVHTGTGVVGLAWLWRSGGPTRVAPLVASSTARHA
jgi:DegV family protein with EDD domain